MSFDAYHQWLGIPPEQQPADCYQLLGVRRFEQNPTVISNAAERQLLMLKSLQNGPHGALTQQLMNEVSAARVRLLDPQKKAEYDAQLRTGGRRKRAVPPPAPTIPRDDGTVEPPFLNESGSVTPSLAARPNARRGTRHDPRQRRTRAVLLGLCGAVAVVAAVLIVGWLAIVRDSKRPKEREQTRVAKVPATHAQPTRTGPPESFQADHRTSDDGETSPTESIDQEADADTTPLDNAVEDTSMQGATGDDPSGTLSTDVQPTHDVTDDSVARPPDEPEPPVGDESDAFGQLPTQLNLIGTVEATEADYVFVGDLASPALATWKISIEDYGAPADQPRFSVGNAAVDDTTLHWPVRFRSSELIRSTADGLQAVPKEVARVDCEARKLSLSIGDPNDQGLLSALSVCAIVLENEYGRHHIQLSLPASMPPIPLGLEKTKQTVLLENVAALEAVPLDRWELEILNVGPNTVAVGEEGRLQAGYGKEITVPLNDELHCELGIALVRDTDQYGIGLMPRYLVNERRLPMVPSKLEREIAQSKSQLFKNQRELAQAQNAMRTLPGEIARVRSLPTRSAPEAAMKQSQLSRLSGMLNSAQSRIRRLSKVVPDQSEGLVQMQNVLEYANELAGEATLQFRLLARSEYGEYLLLVAAEVSP